MRDLTDAPPGVIAAERARVAREGLGAEILARQEADGSWHRAGAPAWLPTLFTLLLLRATGVDRQESAVERALERLESSLRWNDNGGRWDLRPAATGRFPLFAGEIGPGNKGGWLGLGVYVCAVAE